MKSDTAAVQSWGQVAIAAAATLGLAWATLPALYTVPDSPDRHLVAVAVILAAAGIGATALARKPRSAILFAIVMSASAGVIAAQVGTYASYTLSCFAILYGIVTVMVIRHNHRIVAAAAAAEAEVRKQNEIIALALNDFSEGASDWLWETDAQGRLTYCSRGLAECLGKPLSAILGQPFAGFFSGDAGAAGWDRLLLAMEARQGVECAVELAFGANRNWWQMSCHPVTRPDGAFAGHRGVAHNITAERQARRKLAEEREAALRDNASKSQFIAMMSHELRTPPNAIVGYTELLLSPSAGNLSEAQSREYLQIMRDSSRHLQSLISGVLDVSRIEKGKLQIVDQEVDAAEIAEVAVKMCRDVAEQADITVVAEVIEGIELHCDATRIKQVLINLVTNAIKFSDIGGSVRMEFEALPDGGLAIAVHDRGIGIAAVDVERIFDPFVQVEQGSARRFGGMGLGLPISRRIAALHGGDVTIESTEGVGTTARLLLPPARVRWPVRTRPEAIRAA